MREKLKIGDYVQILKSSTSKMLIESIVDGTAKCIYLGDSGKIESRKIQTSVLYETEKDETFKLLISMIKKDERKPTKNDLPSPTIRSGII